MKDKDAMKCPYSVNRTYVTGSKTTYDEEGRQSGFFEVQTDTVRFSNCLKENCGAYRDGCCRFNSA